MDHPTATQSQAQATLEPGARQRVLRAAARLFAERGYDAVSVREIVEAAGLTKPAMYYHFGSKEGVAQAIVADFMQAADAVRGRVFATSGDVQRALETYCNQMLALAAERKDDLAFGFTCWFGRSSLRHMTERTSEYDCKVSAEWTAWLQQQGLSENQAGNVLRVFWALLMQELLRVVHCPYWQGDAGDTGRVFASLVLDGALGDSNQRTNGTKG